MHKPIQFKDLSLSFPHKTCFEGFSGQLHYGERIAIIGQNGTGKSTLLKMLQGSLAAAEGALRFPDDLRMGYLPQIIDDFPELSGGQRLNKLLSEILAKNPNLLLLDEPTNHLDSANRHSLMRMLANYPGSLVIASHDVELINSTSDRLWHIDSQRVTVFTGRYQDYQQEIYRKKATIEQELAALSRQKKEAHLSLMKEQGRNKNTRLKGEKHIQQRKWPTIRSATKMGNAVETGNKRLSQLNERRAELLELSAEIYQPETIQPKFKLHAMDNNKALITVREGAVSYEKGPVILQNINFNLRAGERIALCGENGSGKSSLLKAFLDETKLTKTGEWMLPKPADLGYLDQHYNNLAREKTVLEMMSNALPHCSHEELRRHLNNFLFRKNEEVYARVESLSGGEKARLSLAIIAANPPKLLLLDELTNNLDLETRAHLIQVLAEFPGAMIVISHDEQFLSAIEIETRYQIKQGYFEPVC